MGGPESGDMLVMIGAGQLGNMVVGDPLHSFSTSQVESSPHQAQSKAVSVLAARQTVQLSPSSAQLYSVAVRKEIESDS